MLNESATTVLSEPVPSKRRKSVLTTSFLSDGDSFTQTKNPRRSGNYKTDEESCKNSPSLKSRKSRPKIFTTIRTSKARTNNVFNNLLENLSSNSESSIPAVDKNQQRRTEAESQKSGVQNIREIEPNQNIGPIASQERRSKDIEQSHNSSDQNLSTKQGTTGSFSKTANTSISSNSKAKTSVIGEIKENSTFENNSSDVELKKKRPGLFRRNRKSMETNAFDSIFTSDGESIQEVVKLNQSQERNSSTNTSEKNRGEKQNTVDLRKSQRSRLTPSQGSNNLGSKLKEREDLSDLSSEIDVEYKNDESTKSNREENLQSTSRKRKSDQLSEMGNLSPKIFHKIPVSSVSRSKHASQLLNSEEEEDLISVGSQGIINQSNQNKNLNTSKNYNSSFNKSRGTSQNLVSSRRSSRLSDNIQVPDQLSIFAGELQYESTRKIDVPKFTKSQESRRVSRLDSTSNDERSKKISGELAAEELSTRKSTSLIHSRNVSSRKIFEDEEVSDIKVSDPKNNSSAKNNSISSPEKRKSRSQYESTKKIEVSTSRKSQSRRTSKLDSARNKDLLKELRINDSTEELPRKMLNSRKTFNEEETSDIEVSEENRNESRHSTSKNNTNVTRSSGDFANSQDRSSETGGSADSQRSHTISLSEAESIQSEIPNENSLPLNNTLKITNQSSKTSSIKRYKTSFIPSDISSDEENLETNNLLKKQTVKPTITSFEILKANVVDIKKFKEGTKGVSEKNNSPRSPPAIRDIPVLSSIRTSSIFTKDHQMLQVEEEFRQLYGENSEIASTSRDYSQVSRNLFSKGIDNEASRDTSNNKSSSDLQKILEDEDDIESNVSENPLLYYSKYPDEEEVEESEYEETSPVKISPRKNSPLAKEDFRERKQKMIYDYFKRKDAAKTEGASQSQRIPFAEAARDKKIMADVKKQVEALIAPIKQELFKKPKEPEPPKNKLFGGKGTLKKKNSKPINPAYLVNGVVYKPPKLPRPKHWATDRLYKFIWKKIEPKYKGNTRVRSEKFVLRLSQVFDKVMKVSYKNYVKELDSLMEEMAKLGLIVNRKDFNDFCIEFLPYDFRVKATPILLPGNKMSIPYDPKKFYAPILRDESSLCD